MSLFAFLQLQAQLALAQATHDTAAEVAAEALAGKSLAEAQAERQAEEAACLQRKSAKVSGPVWRWMSG